MNSISKCLGLILILIMAISSLSLLMIKPAYSQSPLPSFIPEPSYPTPSVPEFTVQLVGPPYTQPTTYSLNSSTGQIDAQIGYTNNYSYVKITVKDQSFTPFNSSDEGPVSLMYNVRIKSHEATDNWGEVYNAYDGYSTVQTMELSIEGQTRVGPLAGTQIDIQVEAMIGTVHRILIMPYNPWIFDGQLSGWSNTQTINIPANTPLGSTSTPSPSTLNPTVTPTSVNGAPSSSGLLQVITIALVAIAFLLIIIISLLLHIRKRKTV